MVIFPAFLLGAALQPLVAVPLPPIPDWEEHSITAVCRGRPVALRYAIRRPGPDVFSEVSVGGKKLSDPMLANLNRMLAGYMLDNVSLYSCEGEGDEYELKFTLHFSKEEERHIYLMGLRQGQLRVIR